MTEKKLEDFSFEDLEKLVDKLGIQSPSKPDGNKESEAKFQIVKIYDTLASSSKNQTVFAKVRWRNYERYDLRKWSKDLSIPFKGITFSLEELKKFPDIKKDHSANSDGVIATYSEGNAEATICYNLLTLSESTVKTTRWIKQINVVDWGYGKKVDFRKWTPDYKKCSKGICLNWDVFTKFYNIVLSILREGK